MVRVALLLVLLAGCAGTEMSDNQRMAAASALTAVSQGYFAAAAASTPRTVYCYGC